MLTTHTHICIHIRKHQHPVSHSYKHITNKLRAFNNQKPSYTQCKTTAILVEEQLARINPGKHRTVWKQATNSAVRPTLHSGKGGWLAGPKTGRHKGIYTNWCLDWLGQRPSWALWWLISLLARKSISSGPTIFALASIAFLSPAAILAQMSSVIDHLPDGACASCRRQQTTIKPEMEG